MLANAVTVRIAKRRNLNALASVAGIVDRKWTTAPASVVLLVRISRLSVLAILVKGAKTNLLSVPATNNLVAMGLGDRPQLEGKQAMAKPTQIEIKKKAISGLIDLAKADSGEYWERLAAELSPRAGLDERSELATQIKAVAIKQVEALAKPKAVGVLGVSRPRR